MSRSTVLKFRVQQTDENVDYVLLYLASESVGDNFSQKIAINNGVGFCQAEAPRRYRFTWYIAGSPGGAMRMTVHDGDGDLLAALTGEDTIIPDDARENFGNISMDVREDVR